MGDRSDEVTKSADSRSTEELLEETDEILSGSSGAATESVSSDDGAVANEGTTGTTADSSVSSASRGWLPSRPSSLVPWRYGSEERRPSVAPPSRYVSPRSLLAVALVIGAGLLVGGTVVPVAGRIVGTLAASFFLGALTSRRRYLEVASAAVTVGAVGAVFDDVLLTTGGSSRAVVAVGAGTAVAAAVVGYYFGRDLRNGFRRDVSSGE